MHADNLHIFTGFNLLGYIDQAFIIPRLSTLVLIIQKNYCDELSKWECDVCLLVSPCIFGSMCTYPSL